MDNTGYIALTRQSGLMREMGLVANNIANISTTGYRQEAVIFSEYIRRQEGAPSLSMTKADSRNTSFIQGAIVPTGNEFDLAIEGEGFFMIGTEDGERLTRAGNFALDANGRLVTPDGLSVLDAGGAPITVPFDAGRVKISQDGTISAAAGPISQIGVFTFTNPLTIEREDGVRFFSDDGYDAVEETKVLQGYVESSNVNPVLEIARMIEVQRAYEMGQEFLKREDERVTEAIRAVMR